MFKLEIRKMIFEARVENFLYIDKTGLFFKKLQDILGLDNFTPNVSNSSFLLSNKTFQGNLSSQNIALINIQPSTPEEFEPIIGKVLTKFPEVYEEPRLKRIGYRFLYFQEKSKRDILGFLRKFYVPNLEEGLLKRIEKSGSSKIEDIEVKHAFNMHDDFCVTFRAYPGKKTIEDEKNPRKNITQEGLVVDIDCYIKYDSKDVQLTLEFVAKELPQFLKRASNTAKLLIQNFQNF